MADNDVLKAISDALGGFNSMQYQAGLYPGMNPQLSAQSTPRIKSPGEMSAELTAQSIQTVQQMQHQEIQRAEVASPGGGAFSRQYQQAMSGIISNYQNPYQAQYYQRRMPPASAPAPILSMPSPMDMTDPSMGIYRQQQQQKESHVSAAAAGYMGRYLRPLIPTPFLPHTPPKPFFQTQYHQQQNIEAAVNTRDYSLTMAAIPTGVHGLTGAALTGAGALGGARMLSQFGSKGRLLGGVLGAGAGAYLGFGAAGEGAASLSERALHPALESRAYAHQMQTISRNFVVGGGDKREGQRGLSLDASLDVVHGLEKSAMTPETGGYNMRDLMRITSSAGQNHMMDMSQNSQQIVQKVKTISKSLKTFMQLAEDPDIQSAMRKMASMQAMGLTLPETNQTMHNAHKFARMAGMTVDSIQRAGAPGAMTYQSLGMSAGQGFNVGMASSAFARQAVSGESYTTAQKSMAGGTSGISQQFMESAGASMKVDFPMLAMLKRDAKGQLAIDEHKMHMVTSGKLSMTEQARLAQQNIERLGGAKVITELSTRKLELQDQLGRKMGPAGSMIYSLQQARSLDRETGGVMGIGGALKMITGDEQRARTLELAAKSPGFWRNLQKQEQDTIQESRFNEARQREQQDSYNSFTSQVGRWGAGVASPFTHAAHRVGEAYDSMSGWFTTRAQQQAANSRGASWVSTDSRFQQHSAGARAGINRYVAGGGLLSSQGHGVTDAQSRGGSGWDVAGAAWNVGKNVASFAISAPLAIVSDTLLPEVNVSGDLGVQAHAMQGGIEGWGARNMPSATLLGQALGSRDADIGNARDIASLSRTMRTGREMTDKTELRIDREFRQKYKALSSSMGGGGPVDLKGFKGDITSAIIKDMRKNASIWGSGSATATHIKGVAIKALVKRGVPANVATTLVASTWDQSIGASIMRRVQQEGGPKVQGVLAKQKDKESFGAAEAAATFEKYQDNLEKVDDNLRDAMGLDNGIFSGTSDKAYSAYKDLAAASHGDDEMFMRQALALSQSDNRVDSRQGREMLDKLEKSMDPEAYQKLQRRIQAKKTTPEQQKALVAAAKATAAVGSFKEQRAFVTSTTEDIRGNAGADLMARGAVTLADLTGTGAFRKLAGGGGRSVESMTSFAEGLSNEDLEEIKKTDKGLYESMLALRKGGTKKEMTTATRHAQGALVKVGEIAKKEGEVGGKGAGGTEEKEAKHRIMSYKDLAKSFTGKGEEDLARAVPLFAKATNDLKDSAKMVKEVAIAVALDHKLPLLPFL